MGFMKKVLGTLSRLLHPKTKLFSVKCRRNLEVLCLQGLQKTFIAQFHDLRVQKRSCLLLSWNVFWNFLLCEAYEESFGYIFTSYVSKNEAVSCEVQMHFGRFHLVRFVKNVSGALSRFMCPKTKLFATKFKRILEVFFVQALWR